MTNKQKNSYEDTQTLRTFLQQLHKRKFQLDCGHHVTFGHFLGNDVVVHNGKNIRLTCSDCCM